MIPFTRRLYVFLCLGTAVYAQDITTVLNPNSGTPVLQWNGGSHDGYAVQSLDAFLEGTWGYAPPVDQWPVAATNWTFAATSGHRFYRVQSVSRGQWIAPAETLSTLSTFQVQLLLAALNIPGTPTYGVTIKKITYTTFDHRNQATVATGALAYPTGAPPGPLVSYQHGTQFLKADAPSNPLADDQAFGVAFATDGYVVAMPDFLGLGAGFAGLHPYLHARSEAVACVDMLRASKAYLAGEGIGINTQLFVVGYSQGGHATLALQRELEQFHAAEFPLTASAPMAGPYDMSGTMADLVSLAQPYPNPSYLPYLVFAYDAVYDLFDTPGELFASPYDVDLPPLLDGAHSGSEIDDAMPAIPRDAFLPAYIQAFENEPDHPFRQALEANDLHNWTPQTPTRLYHCSGDTVVSPVNSDVAYSNFVARGATSVSRHDAAPGSDHGDGALPSFTHAKTWFDALRAP